MFQTDICADLVFDASTNILTNCLYCLGLGILLRSSEFTRVLVELKVVRGGGGWGGGGGGGGGLDFREKGMEIVRT